MFFTIYASSATTPFSHSDLLNLLAKSRENNEKLGITGMLLYKEGNFMQVLEGEEAVVRSLHAKIERDPRHKGMSTLLWGTQEKRQFPDWSMGFRDLNRIDVQSVPGYSKFLNTPLTSAAFSSEPTRCQKLLQTFKEIM